MKLQLSITETGSAIEVIIAQFRLESERLFFNSVSNNQGRISENQALSLRLETFELDRVLVQPEALNAK